MISPYYNQNLETPEELQEFFDWLFYLGFKPDIVAVQDGIGASDNGRNHADILTVGSYERAVAKACAKYNIDFWVDLELSRTGDSHSLADSARLSAQLDTARAVGATKVIAYDLAVLGNAGLDSLEKWFTRDSSQGTSITKSRNQRKSKKYIDPRHKEIRYYKLNGTRIKASE